jgi:prepilin-type N-terminal cleavage/methylation domain-containing protein
MRRGFTLIELLTVIAVIGLLASVLLVATNGVRDDAKDAAVLAQMKSAQVAMTRCMNKGKVMYCGYWNGSIGTAINDCNGSLVSTRGMPAFGDSPVEWRFRSGQALCGLNDGKAADGDASLGTWPDISQYGWVYGTRANSQHTSGKFAFYAYKDGTSATEPRLVVCCTHKGCTQRELPSMDGCGSGEPSDSLCWNHHITWSRAPHYIFPASTFCLEEAGLTTGDLD